MLHRISSLCLKFLKTNGPRLHHGFSLNQCASSNCRSAFSIWSPVWFARGQANLTLSFEKTFTSSKRSSPSSNKILLAFGVAGLMKFLGLADQNEDSELIQIIKKAEIALLKKEYNKSEQMFHIALKLAQELQNENGITFVYDRLANVAFDTGRFEKARKLFVEVMQRLLDRGMEKDDLALIHISFKLAKIFESIGDYSTAAIGYQYCLETLRPKLVKENADYADALALWLMLLNGYAYFLHYVGRPEEAFKYFKKARSVREQIGGEHDEQQVLLLNNLGTVSKLRGDTDAALRYFHEAEKLGKNFPDMENFSFVYLNLAYLYMEFKMADRAREYCQKAMTNASRHELKEGIKESEECLSKVNEALKK